MSEKKVKNHEPINFKFKKNQGQLKEHRSKKRINKKRINVRVNINKIDNKIQEKVDLTVVWSLEKTFKNY